MGTESMRVHETHFVPDPDTKTIPAIISRFLDSHEIEPGSLEMYLFASGEWTEDEVEVRGHTLQLAGTIWTHPIHPIAGHALQREEPA